jgi:hypothetical protein
MQQQLLQRDNRQNGTEKGAASTPLAARDHITDDF